MDEVDSNDRLIAALIYVFTPLSPIIILFLEDVKNRPFIKAHNAQALVIGILFFIINIVLSWTCIVPLAVFAIAIYLGYRAYQGEEFVIPVVTDFVKNQGWA